MRLPDVQLDDRRFQDLVDEARMRIGQACPEWTDHNVASPGIVLTEIFAWMTDMLVYRLNQVPDKLHLRLLELLDVRLDPPRAAGTELRFMLAAPPGDPVRIPARATEVSTPRIADEPSIVFTTTEDVTVPAIRPVAYVVERGGAARDVGIADGVAQPLDDDRCPFGQPPEVGDALLLGFADPLGRLVLRVEVDCREAQGAGIRPDDPPLRWEVSRGGGWEAAEVLADETGGFNHGGGRIDLQLPAGHDRSAIGGREAYWVRCRVDDRTRAGERAAYAAPPEISRITAAPVGALVPAGHAEHVGAEELGESDGTPGQAFTLLEAPALPLGTGETLEVMEPDASEWQPWEPCDGFGESGPDDRHFRFDPASGEVELGPCVRTADASWRQHGAVPPKGSLLRMSGYRRGGGAAGNVRAHTLTELRSAIAGVVRVEHPHAARGGVDGETLDHARRRAGFALQSRDRAVTEADFTHLAERASPRVARARCLPATAGQPVRVVVLPRIEAAGGARRAADLEADDGLLAEVARFLDERRLLGTTIELATARVVEVSVVTELEAEPGADLERLQREAAAALERYLDPFAGGGGDGWDFGRALHQGELYGLMQALRGVRFVRLLRIYPINPSTGAPAEQPAGSHLELAADQVLTSASHLVRAVRGA